MLVAMLCECTRLGPRNCVAGLLGRRAGLWCGCSTSGAPEMPFAAAAMAATLLPAVVLMLLRRVTRWAGLMLPTDSECECGRDLGREPPMCVLEWRCCDAGRTLIGSWTAGRVSAAFVVDDVWCDCGEGDNVVVMRAVR